MRWFPAFLWLLGTSLGAQGSTRVSGTVYDSVGHRHLAGAVVQMARVDNPAIALSSTTDAEGRYVFDAVDRGTWLIGFFHPIIDSLALETPTLRVDIRTDEPVRAMLATPGTRTLVARTCGAMPEGRGLWYGRIRHAQSGTLVSGATVLAQWTTLVASRSQVSRQLGTVEDTSRSDGLFAMCGISTDETVVARSWFGADSSGVATVVLPTAGLLYRDLWIAPVLIAERRMEVDSVLNDSVVTPVRVGDRTLRGRVARQNGSPIGGARLRVPDSGAEVMTNSDGFFAFDSLPGGTQTIDVRALGYLPLLRSIDLSPAASDRVDFFMESRGTYLDTVKVIGQRVLESPGYRDFLNRKRRGFGYFMDEDQIERRQPMFFGDLLRMAPGVTVFPTTFGGGTIRMRGMGLAQFCVPAVFIDGMLMAQLEGVDIESFINVEDVRSLEVYTRAGQLPPQFQTLAGCGSIVITTGARRRLPP